MKARDIPLSMVLVDVGKKEQEPKEEDEEELHKTLEKMLTDFLEANGVTGKLHSQLE